MEKKLALPENFVHPSLCVVGLTQARDLKKTVSAHIVWASTGQVVDNHPPIVWISGSAKPFIHELAVGFIVDVSKLHPDTKQLAFFIADIPPATEALVKIQRKKLRELKKKKAK